MQSVECTSLLGNFVNVTPKNPKRNLSLKVNVSEAIPHGEKRTDTLKTNSLTKQF